MGRMVKFLAVVIGVVVSSASPAWAVLLDFAMGPPHPGTVSVSYGGGALPLVGTDINAFNVIGVDTPANSGVLRDVSGTVDFTTGGFVGTGGGLGWFFGPGGFITLTGGVDLNDDGDFTDAEDVPLGTLLFTGAFTGAPGVIPFGPTFKIFGGVFFDAEKDSELAGFYGLSADGIGFGWDGGINLSFHAPGGPGAGFVSTIEGSGDILNTPIVPEPAGATTLLLGLGLLGGLGWRRRWF